MSSITSTISYPVSPAAAGQIAMPLPFSLATQVGNLLFVSGQASVDETGVLVQGSFEEQFRRTMDNLRRVLEAAGSGFDKVVQVRSYVLDASDFEIYNSLYREYFPEPYPARTTLTGCLPENVLYEIDCVAVV